MPSTLEQVEIDYEYREDRSGTAVAYQMSSIYAYAFCNRFELLTAKGSNLQHSRSAYSNSFFFQFTLNECILQILSKSVSYVSAAWRL
jgi:hypothetical protein